MRGSLLTALLVLAGAGECSAAPAPPIAMGPFQPRPALALYLVTDGRPCALRARVSGKGERVSIRLFDPDEKVLARRFAYPVSDSGEPFGPAQLDRAGIYQLRVVCGLHRGTVEVELSRPLPYGVSFQNGDFKPWPGQPEVMHVWVPRRAEIFGLAAARGVEFRAPDGGAPIHDGETPLGATDVVWQARFPDPKTWSFRAWGFPVILCDRPATARRIRASVEYLDDGRTVVCHKFQKRIAELLPGLLDRKNVGDTQELLSLLFARKTEWLAEPERNIELLNAYSLWPTLQEALEKQNTDPRSHWGGSVGAWRSKEGKPFPENRWDRLRPVGGLRAGASGGGQSAEALGEAYSLAAPFNAYRGRKELLYRAASISLRNLMSLDEAEVFYTSDMPMHRDPYAGFPGFVLGRMYFPEYAWVAPHMPPEIRAVWTEALWHLFDRYHPMGLVSARNQSAHFLPAWAQFAIGSGDPEARKLSREYARYFAATAPAAGYHVESMGPDCTYCGMQHWHMGMYYRLSGDREFLEAIRKSYRFFNHTVAPEPGGGMIGCCNFAHRTAGTFAGEQWTGARGILHAVLPEVGLWASRHVSTPESRKKAASHIEARMRSERLEIKRPLFRTSGYRYWNEAPDTSGVWPALERGEFLRDFGGELIAVKRRGYYATVYVGRPTPHEMYIHRRGTTCAAQDPLPNDAENTGGPVNARQVCPFTGGGLSQLWTPGFGTAIVAANWSALCHNGLVAVDANDKRAWADYFSVRHTLDAPRWTLEVDSRLWNHPIRAARRYAFGPDAVEIQLALRAESAVRLKDLIENIPLLGGKRNGLLIACGQGPVEDGTHTTDRLRLRDQAGQGVDILFDRPYPIRVRTRGPKGAMQVNRVEVVLPVEWAAGQTRTLRYRIRPAP
ncbi:MAG: hypothetical protein JXR37_11980 [Kiritimatiellae bacterium]|nr:hypothetical protein [Kiritimatiellia bacterium]